MPVPSRDLPLESPIRPGGDDLPGMAIGAGSLSEHEPMVNPMSVSRPLTTISREGV
jgi:hypothetical protein